MQHFPTNPIFGETTALRVSMADTDGAAFTIASATVTIKEASAGTVIRNGVAATVDDTNKRVYYVEAFSTANGYAEGSKYVATFSIVTSDGYEEKFEGDFVVKSANDE